MEKIKMQSLDVAGSNIKKIRKLFPHCVTERRGENGELKPVLYKMKPFSDDIGRR